MARAKASLAAVLCLAQLAALPEVVAHASAHFARPAPAPPPTALDVVRRQLQSIEAKGASLSIGRAFRQGGLRNPALLPMEGVGYWVLRPERNVHYGTDDLIGGLIETCAELKGRDPAMPPLAVGDISRPKGGRVYLHLSHRSGRDADLLFFWLDGRGRPQLAEDFVRFDARGRGRYRGKLVQFDARRNWALVRGLLANPRFGDRVTRIFVSRALRTLLLDYAQGNERDPSLVRRARRALQEPAGNGGRHDDHFHVRVACSPREAAAGCRD
ncbi:MAG: penicillin-insensitive murein endopeptidase [Elusimicrobia bacterium]|nr:penicillin-insensitive murein endopeptidase [Elusimicrobiota bacterium]